MTPDSTGLSRSIQARLVDHAKSTGIDPNRILTRYAAERFLYRLSRSEHAHRFVLKGALLLLVWLGENLRPTRDVDLLGSGELSDDALVRIFGGLCALEVEPDGMVHHSETISVASIRPEDAYGGRRVTLRSNLGSARLTVQVDVGIGDVVIPSSQIEEYPSLLDLPRPRLSMYPPESAIAEKSQAMVSLGLPNSRMKDYFDVWALSNRMTFEFDVLAEAIRSTFERRTTAISTERLASLFSAIRGADEKQEQWRAFLRKNGIETAPAGMSTTIDAIEEFLGPVVEALADPQGERSAARWSPGGPWRSEKR